MRLENKVAIVTGAGRGLGKGIALKLAQEGAKVIVSDIMQETADECVAEIRQKGGTGCGSCGKYRETGGCEKSLPGCFGNLWKN